jgi:glycosyltransferase involved in cell wall biosynthesis
MPAYNAERTIAGAINSILTQTYINWELIIIDDGSLDNTKEQIARFKDKRIKVYRRLHQGLVSARNYGNQKAKCKYCIVQDADDFSLPDRLEKVMQVFSQKDADVVLHSAYVSCWNAQYQCPERRYRKAGGNVLKNEFQGWPAYKRECWVKKPFRLATQFSYDWMMHLDWYLSGFKYEFVDEALYEYVRYQGSVSDQFERSGKRAESFKKIKEIVLKEYGQIVETSA